MFCTNCGQQLPDGSKFCSNCGASLESTSPKEKMMPVSQTTLVPAKCTSCGAALEVDPGKETAICPFCNNAYIVEKAINNYNVSVNGNVNISNSNVVINNGQDKDNTLKRADEYFEEEEYGKALEYYQKVLDLDMNCKRAKEQVELLDYTVYASRYDSIVIKISGVTITDSSSNQTILVPIKDINMLCKNSNNEEISLYLNNKRSIFIKNTVGIFPDKVNSFIKLIKEHRFGDLEDCYYTCYDTTWVFADKIVYNRYSDGTIIYYHFNDIKGIKVKKKLLLSSLIIDGRAEIAPSVYSRENSFKNPLLTLNFSNIDEANQVIEALMAGNKPKAIRKALVFQLCENSK